jgi:sulfide:quinone oxidoreductase
MGQFIRQSLAERGIPLYLKRSTKSIDPEQRQVRFEDGTSVPYDLLIAVPPHRPPRAVRECPVAGAGGWIPADPRTLLVRGTTRPCYAIGDVASVPLPGRFDPEVPLVLPKAGVFAEAHGLAVAADIAERVLGLADEDSPRFDGRGACYVEMGAGVAVRGDGEFFATPHPRVNATPATPENMREKLEWVEGWMRKQP